MMDTKLIVFFVAVFLLPPLSGFSALEQRHCCEIGRKWFEDNKGLCPTHPLSPRYFPPTHPSSQPINACLVSLEICCFDQQRKHSCRIAKKAAMVAETCSLSLLRRKFKGLILSNGVDVDVKECCNCCRLGMRGAENNSSCLALHHSPLYSNQCKKTYRSCCLNHRNNTTHLNQSNVQKTQAYHKHPTSNRGHHFRNRGHRTFQNRKKYKTMYDYTSADADTSEVDCHHPCPAGFRCIRDRRNRAVCVRVSLYDGLNYSPPPSPSSSLSLLTTSTTEDSSQSIDLSVDEDLQGAVKEDGNDEDDEEEEKIKGNNKEENKEENREEDRKEKIGEKGGMGCGEGFDFDEDSQVCKDRDECVLGYCTQEHMRCTNTWGSYTCVCEEGFLFNPRTQLCQDKDECTTDKHDCLASEVCVNKEGGFECLSILGGCRKGFHWVGGVCEDTDECEDGTHNCTSAHRCLNTIGSFSCEAIMCDEGFKVEGGECVEDATLKCEAGFRRNKLFNMCEDINECVERRDGRRKKRKLVRWMRDERAGDRIKRKRRMHEERRGKLHNCTADHMTCLNTLGSFQCVCEDGFTYDSSSHTCLDVDECGTEAEGSGEGDICPSNSVCVNTAGSFRCQCQAGFVNEPLSQNCMDLDECALGIHACEQVCANTWGGYKCQCLSGYTTDPNDLNKCKRADGVVGCEGCEGQEFCVGGEESQRCMVITCPEYFVPIKPVTKDKRHVHKMPLSTRSFEDAGEYGRVERKNMRNPGRYRMFKTESYRKKEDGTFNDFLVERSHRHHYKRGRELGKRSGSVMQEQAASISQLHVGKTPGRGEIMCVKENCGAEEAQCFNNQTKSIYWRSIQKPFNIKHFPHPLVQVHLKSAVHFQLISDSQQFDVVRLRSNTGVVRLLRDIEGMELEGVSLKVQDGSNNHIIHFILY